MTPLPALRAALAQTMAAAPSGDIGVAVSGGGDSVALLLLLQDWAAAHGRAIAAVTIDHGLREGSAAEAAGVAALCAARGIPHDLRRWADWDGSGNMQARARDARRSLIAGWASARGIASVALGHTLDDQAETFLMRLARGSGVDGLAAMQPVSRAEHIVWLRPLLAMPRSALRAFLTASGVGWAEDPSNANPAFDRVRARAALGPLADFGLGPARLAATAARMARARAALEMATADLARRCLAEGPAGDVTLDPVPLAGAPEEIRLRLLAGVLGWVAGACYRPRLQPLEAACDAIIAGGIGRGMTLHGCVLRPHRGSISIRREPARAAAPVPSDLRVWDGRWELLGASLHGSLGALGIAGLAQFPDWRAAGLAREALLTLPALRLEGRLVAAPILAPAQGIAFRRVSPLPPPWSLSDLALNPDGQPLC